MPVVPQDLPADLAAFWDERRARIEQALAAELPALGAAPAVLDRAMRHTLLAPGKRIRGVLLLATSELLRGASAPALRLACAVELVHASSLILDDLPSMDNATLRRGQPVLHRVVGEAQAILAAVALLNAGYRVVQTTEGLRDRACRRITERLSWAIGEHGLIGGQVVDLEATGRRIDLDALEFIHSHKTGALFIAAAEMGALAAGARPKDVDALRLYAKNLGLAFQITDDLLDYRGDPVATGKDAGLDRDKTTFVQLCGIDGARQLAEELIDASLDALSRYGRRGARLRALADYVRSRDR